MINTCAELFANFLKDQDLFYKSATDSDGDSVIEVPYQGKTARFFFCGDEGTYLSIYLVYEKVPEEKLADVIFLCNELNCQYKWVTFYVDKDNDIILHDDAILTVENSYNEAFELLVRTFKISDDIKTRIMKTIYA